MRIFHYIVPFALALVALVISGCGASRSNRDGGPGTCPPGCKQCDPQGVCHDCGSPGQDVCNGSAVYHCNPNGTLGDQVKDCDVANGQMCNMGGCFSACEIAASSHSYIGCDYWPTTTLSSQLNPYFDFAVAVANPLTVGDVTQSAPAQITITRGANMVKTVTVMPGEVQTIVLPWVQELSQQPTCAYDINYGEVVCQTKMCNGPADCATGNCVMQNGEGHCGEGSMVVSDGAYHLVSSIPVTVYQFSPLQFEKPENKQTCTDSPANGKNCHSYSNDASILLPTTALHNDYVVVSRQTFSLSESLGFQSFTNAIPGFFAVVATEDNTTVNVTYSANVQPGKGVTAQAPGSMATYTLNKGAVLEVVSKKANSPCANTASEMLPNGATATYCDLGKNYDLTGSLVSADKPVAVFGGHSCSFVPYNKWACDHLEEQITPLDTWGAKVAVVQTKAQVNGEPNIWRVVSGGDNNMIAFDPPAVAMGKTMNKGEYMEFTARNGFLVTGSAPLAVGQYMVGENFTAQGTTVGDPSLGLGVPVEQYRTTYDFITPDTYTKSYVNIIAPPGIHLLLDGNDPAAMWNAIGTSNLSFTQLELKPGAHHVVSTDSLTFGIVVSGIANYTSYLYVGGQNLNQINPG
jgi:hypothetical protein